MISYKDTINDYESPYKDEKGNPLTFKSLPALKGTDFVKYLLAALVIKDKPITNFSNISKIIYDFKEENKQKYPEMLSDINFRVGINDYCSKKIDDGLLAAQTLGYMGKVNPTYNNIVIYFSKQEAENIFQSLDFDDDTKTKIKNGMKSLADKFN
ncbi:MAG: hypothetical protein LBS74_00975 [Oscillospiraceae bacterium]|jgi:hypothetical protein|nr:hypothetical protein [Oscillospiraceae bacterium]